MVALLFVVLWTLGFFVYNIGSMIHFLLSITVIAILLQVIKG
ncbi:MULTISPECIES: lmo0937 family membrane protein [unclassified Flavobacterium]|nr:MULTISPECIES: lmo0937 family membrane protein [unclassified Flavobacterium]